MLVMSFYQPKASEARQAEGKRREEAVGNWGIGLPIVHRASGGQPSYPRPDAGTFATIDAWWLVLV